MLSKLNQGGNKIWHVLGREKTCAGKFSRRQHGSWLKHVYAQIHCFKKDESVLQFDHDHKNKTILIIWYFLDWKFSLEFLKTENNIALKTSILSPMYFRDDIFDSLLPTCATYDEESFIPCGLPVINSFFDNLFYRCLWFWRSAAI